MWKQDIIISRNIISSRDDDGAGSFYQETGLLYVEAGRGCKYNNNNNNKTTVQTGQQKKHTNKRKNPRNTNKFGTQRLG